ncbi:hypothetical protein HDU79_001636 [Rhizoclosmatium sp. JEL0117]|nr:hypothetical protein HDU79_001636 [Rhizoclosmatium sp. JEL0117]
MPKWSPEDSESCASCEQTSKYKCPACGTRSCSLGCVRAHKTATGCTGERNRTGFVPLKQFEEATLRSDFCFLEETSRVADNAARLTDAILPSKKDRDALAGARVYSVREQHLMRNANLRRTRVKLMPKGMSRHEANKSIFHIKSKTIIWTTELIFTHPESVPPLKLSVMQHDVKETTTFTQLLATMFAPSTKTVSADVLFKINAFSSASLDSIHVYLRRENARANEPGYYAVDKNVELKTVLEDKHIVEFPTFLLCLAPLDPAVVAQSKLKADLVIPKVEDVDKVVDDLMESRSEAERQSTFKHANEYEVEGCEDLGETQGEGEEVECESPSKAEELESPTQTQSKPLFAGIVEYDSSDGEK